MIYLDNAATTFPKPETVYQAMDKANRELAINAGRGSYALAREAMKIIDETKNMLLKLVNAEGIGKVAFTPSITIALNEILQGIDFVKGDNFYVSPYEHNAVARVAHALEKTKGINVILMPLIENSLEIDLDKLQYMFSQHKPKAVCCIHVSNVTGYVLPVEDIFKLAKSYNAITVLDTAQSLGLIEIDSLNMNLDFLAFAGHKTLYGPLGIGGFIDLKGLKLAPFIVGGTGSNSLSLEMPGDSPHAYESSSMNIIAIAGLSAALKELNVEKNNFHEKQLTAYLVGKMKSVDGIKVYLPDNANNHIGIVSFSCIGFMSDDIGIILDEDYDIAVRTGYHCAPWIHKFLGDEKTGGTIRIGLGIYSTEEEIDVFVDSLKDILS